MIRQRGMLPRGLAAAACALLAACSQAPVVEREPEDAKAEVLRGSPHAAFEKQQRDRARDLSQQGYFGEAAVVWEVLALMRPDVPEYAEGLRHARSRVESRVAQRLQQADQARKRGEAEQASQLYLQVLSDEPLNAQAADALRAIERERNKRNHLGKLSRLTLTRNSMAAAQVPRSASETAADRNDLEHANLLMHQGEYAEAVRLLERYVKANPQDEGARKSLAEACYQQAERLAATEPKTAAALYQRALKLDPNHGSAARRIRQITRP
jgi:tetratricopeptide (TPR) repeat protein